jgi:transposase
LGRSRGGFGTKFHLVTDGHGTPLTVEVTAGQVSESTRFESIVGQAVACLIGRRKKRRRKPKKLAADKGYSAGYIRDWLKERRIKPVIPHKDNEAARWDGRVKFDRDAYRGRSVVKQCVGWLKEYRRIGTRFEKLAVNYHGMLQLAMIRRYLKMLFSDRA